MAVRGAALTAAALAGLLPLSGGFPYLKCEDQKAQNTSGGTATAGSWFARVLNTAVVNTITGASLASNQITLPAGTYEFRGSCPSVGVLGFQCRLRDTTNSATLWTGTSEFTTNAATVGTRSLISGRFTLAASAVLEFQEQVGFTTVANGLGQAANVGGEVYAEIEFKKVG